MLRAAVIDLLRDLLAEHLETLGDVGRFLSHPPDPSMGDLAFGCFPLAKAMRRSPNQIAEDLAARVEPAGLIEAAEAAGPYVNFRADPSALLDGVARAVADRSLFAQAQAEVSERVMIEFSQPNTHKTFHVGHLRNVALGDSLVRIHRARGHHVIAANYYGDFGLDVAKCLWWLRTHPERTAPPTGRTHFLGAAYVAANGQIKVDHKADSDEVKAAKAAKLDEARQILHGMESQQPEVWALYQETRQWCLDEFAEVYQWLDVHFDVDYFESQVEEPASALVDEYMSHGVFEKSEGAVICRLEPDSDTPALVRKSDGTSLYLTWDLALAKHKFDDYDIERSVYVVGSEQRFHFTQLFLTLGRMGYARAKDCRHVAYELVMLPGPKKMSSRDGTAIPLHELRAAVEGAIDAKLLEAEAARTSRVPAAARDETVHRLAVACLKYGMLSVSVNKSVIFDLDDWVNFQGNSGAYLLYSLARIRSIFRAGDEDVVLADGFPTIQGFGADLERGLLSQILKLPAVVARAEGAADPSPIANWAYDTAQAFSKFYNVHKVLEAETAELRRARLTLLRALDEAMTEGLGLLGITPVDAM
ncbi:MAG: arginine--tRNA ligase [Myxococcales bacterium]|nr:arginine--tRNA ligase [Myxococcales bacterium]